MNVTTSTHFPSSINLDTSSFHSNDGPKMTFFLRNQALLAFPIVKTRTATAAAAATPLDKVQLKRYKLNFKVFVPCALV